MLVVVLVVLTVIDGPARSVLERLGWTDRDDSFTELYFPDHLALPDSVVPGAPVAFDFSIRNLEGSTSTYTWQVVIGDEPAAAGGDPAASVILQGEQELLDGDAVVVRVERVPDVPVGSWVVSVVLVGRAESIHFPISVESEPPAD